MSDLIMPVAKVTAQVDLEDIKAGLEKEDIVKVVRCKDCKYNLNNARRYDDPDQILTYAWCNTEAFQENDFCSKGKRKGE